jgi:hypothetical protein
MSQTQGNITHFSIFILLLPERKQSGQIVITCLLHAWMLPCPKKKKSLSLLSPFFHPAFSAGLNTLLLHGPDFWGQQVISHLDYTISLFLFLSGVGRLRCPSLWGLANVFHARFMLCLYLSFPSCALLMHSWGSTQENVISSNGAEQWVHFMRDNRMCFFLYL